MPDALIVTTRTDLREIIRDAVSEAVARYERIPELLSTKSWQHGLTSARTPCGNGCLATIVRVCVRACASVSEDAVIAWLEDRGG